MNDDIKSTREAFIKAMIELAEESSKYLLVCADSLLALRASSYKSKYPDRVFDVGIAEQNALGFSAGLASSGFTPFVGTYAGFITMRACEQVRTFIAYPGLNVKMIGLNGGIFGGEREGVTHQFFEDIGILRSIPGITIITPADAAQTYKATKEIAAYDGPVYMRLGSGREYSVFNENDSFNIGKIRIIKQYGNDVSIFANGFILKRVLDAVEILKSQNINATVVEVHTLKPVDTESITGILEATGCAVTVEDHNIIGGLGSVISEVSVENVPVPIVRLGIKDVFPQSGEANELLDNYGMSSQDIINAVKKSMIKKEKLQKKFKRR